MKSRSLFHSERTPAHHDDRAVCRQQTCPRADSSFQASIEEPVASLERDVATRPAGLRTFRQISVDDLEEKTIAVISSIFAVYALVIGLCTWSLIALGPQGTSISAKFFCNVGGISDMKISEGGAPTLLQVYGRTPANETKP